MKHKQTTPPIIILLLTSLSALLTQACSTAQQARGGSEASSVSLSQTYLVQSPVTPGAPQTLSLLAQPPIEAGYQCLYNCIVVADIAPDKCETVCTFRFRTQP